MKELSEVERLLLEVLIDACGTGDNTVRLDSACIRSYTDAMLYLAEKGAVRVEAISRRRVICLFPHQK